MAPAPGADRITLPAIAPNNRKEQQAATANDLSPALLVFLFAQRAVTGDRE